MQNLNKRPVETKKQNKYFSKFKKIKKAQIVKIWAFRLIKNKNYLTAKTSISDKNV